MARRQEAMEAARRKMQEELDAKAADFKEKLKKVQKWSSVWKNNNGLPILSDLN